MTARDKAIARQAGVRFIDGELVPFTEELTGLVDSGLGAGATAIGISDDDFNDVRFSYDFAIG